jgi:hypothetical protein
MSVVITLWESFTKGQTKHVLQLSRTDEVIPEESTSWPGQENSQSRTCDSLSREGGRLQIGCCSDCCHCMQLGWELLCCPVSPCHTLKVMYQSLCLVQAARLIHSALRPIINPGFSLVLTISHADEKLGCKKQHSNIHQIVHTMFNFGEYQPYHISSWAILEHNIRAWTVARIKAQIVYVLVYVWVLDIVKRDAWDDFWISIRLTARIQ